MDILLGLQWGDEGKGKIVDVLTPRYDVIARFQGGPNAGHTLEFDGKKQVLHLIPSGIFRKDAKNLIGGGVVLCPIALQSEIEEIRTRFGIDPKENLFLSKKTHLILPTHRLLDAHSEKEKGEAKIGSTLKGITPTYMDKTGRSGLRVGDILSSDFKQKYETLKKKHLAVLGEVDFSTEEQKFFEAIEFLKTLQLVEGEYWINDAILAGKKVLAEGAQGSLLDIDFGAYPFVTSSSTISAGACIGLGVAPTKVKNVFGIFKAYCTRVGSGPFPTELSDATGEKIRKIGNEFGATTGRPRRCGWLDLPALKYSIMLNGVTELIMMKADVLSGFEEIKVCTDYGDAGQMAYKIFPGWKDLSKIRSIAEFPDELKNYIKFIEDSAGVPITILSVGPDRKQTIVIE